MGAIPTDFEPSAGSSNYLKLTAGKHRIRILSDAIAGYSWWIETPEGGKKPQRIRLVCRAGKAVFGFCSL
jgi:predicted secreted protein